MIVARDSLRRLLEAVEHFGQAFLDRGLGVLTLDMPGTGEAPVKMDIGAERMFSLRADEVIGQPLTVLMPERYREPHLAGMRRLERTGRPLIVGQGPVELHGLRGDGGRHGGRDGCLFDYLHVQRVPDPGLAFRSEAGIRRWV